EIIAPDSAARRFLERVRFARRNGDDTLPDWDEENFKRLLPELAEPYLNKVKNFNSLKQLNFFDILKNSLDYAALTALNSSCPDKYLTPAGQEIAIDYSGEQPTLQVPIQQLYGETVHPCVGKNRLPLRLELLSPARRPVQITCDLPGFWRGSWSLVRTEMRSSYPKHDWPEHPETVAARRSSVKKHLK
ncbi:MAG: ATP-dependent helicase HrpB, partial [Lentisphaeria bacterium]|nr:ATP-dependent helicase HrpB [Lentisphaeria bacterium]